MGFFSDILGAAAPIVGGIFGGPVGAAVGGLLGGAVSKKAANTAADANQRAIDANAYQGEIATDQYDEYKNTYRPLERAVVADAQNYDTPEARDQAAGEAQATVSSQLGLARDRLARTSGLDPSSAAAQAAASNLELKGAAMGAIAQNTARLTAQDKGYARKLDALGLGKGLVMNASTGMANASNSASAIAKNASAEAGQTAAGVGALTNGVVNGLSKIGASGIGGYDSWVSGNSGVVKSTGLSYDEISTGF